MQQMGPHSTVHCHLMQLILGLHAPKVNDNKWHKMLVCIHTGHCQFIYVASLLFQMFFINCLLYLILIGPQNCLFGLNAYVVWNMRMLQMLIGMAYSDLENQLNLEQAELKSDNDNTTKTSSKQNLFSLLLQSDQLRELVRGRGEGLILFSLPPPGHPLPPNL